MYIINDICYADGNAEDIRIKSAKPLQGRMLLVTFESGERRLFDTTRLTGSAFKPLDDPKIFENITIFHGVIIWADGEIDIAPEYVYDNSTPYEDYDLLIGPELLKVI